MMMKRRLDLQALLHVAPTPDVDPEDADVGRAGSDGGSGDEDGARDAVVAPSESRLRKRLPLALAGPKYAGRRVTRRDLEDDEDAENDGSTAEEDVDADGSTAEDEDEPRAAQPALTVPVEASDALLQELRGVGAAQDLRAVAADPLEEAEKGRHVRQQMLLWDKAMDARIRLQRASLLANRLPPPGVLRAMVAADGSGLEEPHTAAQTALLLLMDDLVEYQQLLRAQSTGSEPALKRARLTTLPTDVWAAVSAPYSEQRAQHLETMDKWSGRSLGAVPAKKALKALNQNIEAQLQQVMADKDRLLKRIHSNRSTARQLGVKRSAVVAAVDDEIVDDSDFYQQQLRDLIEAKASDAADGVAEDDPAVLARQWLATQQYRQKIKNRVDTRASKGRKVRYDVHPKLVNFMVPVPSDAGWHDGMRDVLFASLLGRSVDGDATNGHADEGEGEDANGATDE